MAGTDLGLFNSMKGVKSRKLKTPTAFARSVKASNLFELTLPEVIVLVNQEIL